jgi:hypothetical protein
MFVGLPCAFIKVTQSTIHKCITWLKKFIKDKQTWEKACIEFGLWLRKLNKVGYFSLFSRNILFGFMIF